jgi:hypothetical protein
MRTSIVLRASALVVGLLGASCSTHGQRSDIVVSAVLAPAFTPAAGTTPASCACPAPGANESEFLSAGGAGLAVCLQVENRLANNAGNLRVNTNDFLIDELHLSYENAGGPAASLPAGEIVVASNGLLAAGGKMTIPVVLVPASVGAAIPARSAVRVHAYFRGHLLDTSRVRSSEYEYLVIGCGASCAAANCPPAF